MIRIITGDFGSGKTQRIIESIQKDVACGREAILLVPEQETVSVESRMAALLPPSATLSFEVSNFSRFANTVFRSRGGLCYHYADRSTRALCMWRAMREAMPILHDQKGELELGRVRRMAAAMRELSSLSLSPEDLSAAAEGITDAPRLKEKLEDLSLIATCYRQILSEKYDDAETELDRLYRLLLDTQPIIGTHIYLDGFVSFTEQQWRILRVLAKTCDITVTLTLPAARKNNPAFLETKKTYARILALKHKDAVAVETEDCGPSRRANHPLLAEVLSSLFDENKAPVCSEKQKKEENPPIRLLVAEDAMAECEWIASDILRRVMKEGAHYRDFAIIARRAEEYTGILDSVFAAAGIPLFMSKHTDVSAYAAVKLIYSAYAVWTANWRMGDVISYCKCGLSGIEQSKIDLFELYVSRWKLNGSRFTEKDKGWTMNPDGYTEKMTERGKNTLACAEEVRQTLLSQLAPLAPFCRGSHTVKEHAAALFAFLSGIGLEKTLAARAEEASLLKNKAEADELSRLFGVICDSLDRLVACMGEIEVKAEEFVDLLHLLFGELSLSRIPSSLDEVTVGSADLIRIGRAKHVYLVGVSDGEFPAPAVEDSIFTDGDRERIRREFEKKDIDVSVDVDLFIRAAREYFCFARAFAAASDSVCLAYAEKTLGGAAQKPAPLFTAIAKRFSLPVIRQADLPPIERIWSRALAEDRLGLLFGTPAGQALENTLSQDEAGRALCARHRAPLSAEECSLSPETANALFGKRINLTQSRMDAFGSCPFFYFCAHVLKLDAAKENLFTHSDTGNLLHAILEELFKRIFPKQEASEATEDTEKKKLNGLTKQEVLSMADDLIEEYIASICPDERHRRSPKMQHLFDNLRHAFAPVVDSLYEELLQSEFVPTLFETDISAKGADNPGPLSYQTSSGTPIAIHGRIDRVDVWENEGKTYLRVIDYKSGDQKFSLENVERGLGLQLLVYLFSLWKSENPLFREKLGGGELMPAGALYVAARSTDRAYEGPVAPDKANADAEKTVYRRGLLLDDRKILEAMEKLLEGRYIPPALSQKKDVPFEEKDFTPSSRKEFLASYEKMGELVETLEHVISSIGEQMQSGKASATPQCLSGKSHPCEYCDMAPVCRASQK